jgi:hypothetical protein
MFPCLCDTWPYQIMKRGAANAEFDMQLLSESIHLPRHACSVLDKDLGLYVYIHAQARRIAALLRLPVGRWHRHIPLLPYISISGRYWKVRERLNTKMEFICKSSDQNIWETYATHMEKLSVWTFSVFPNVFHITFTCAGPGPASWPNNGAWSGLGQGLAAILDLGPDSGHLNIKIIWNVVNTVSCRIHHSTASNFHMFVHGVFIICSQF